MRSRLSRLWSGWLVGGLLQFARVAEGQEAWTTAPPATTQNLWGVAHGAGQFVAVGEGSALLSSPDGLTWAARVVPTPGYWLVGVAHGNGTWVVVGDRGLILTSTDLVAWSLRASGTASRLNGVAFGGGRWIAVADSGELLTSTDAITWTRLKPSGDRLRGIVHAYGQFLITGDNGLVRSTVDATDYDERILPGSFFLEAVTHARRTFVAVGEGGFAVRSGDGLNWTASPTGSAAHFRGLAFFNNQFIAAGTDGTVLTSPDAVGPWATRRSGTTALLTSAAASEAAAVVVGFGGTVLRSAPTPSAPVITSAPREVTEVAGSNVLLEVAAAGSLPLAYQWSFNGEPLPGATSDRLFLPGVQLAQAGAYAVRVSNAQGAATTGPAFLRLVGSTAPGPIVDPVFLPQLAMPNGIAAAVEQPDGKIVIGGAGFFVTPGVSPFALARLNRDGSLDASFALGSGLNSGASVAQLVLQPDGKVLVAGSFESIHGVRRPGLARLNLDGSVDVSFTAPPARVTGAPAKVAVQADGKVLVLAGSTLFRLRPDGSEDASFTAQPARDFGVFATGGIAVIGTDRVLRRIRADGTPDPAPIQYTVPGYTGGSIFEPGTLRSPDSLLSSAEGRVYGLSSYPLTIADRGSHHAIVELDGGTAPFFKLFYSGNTALQSYTYLPTTRGTLVVAVNARASGGTRLEDRTGSVSRYSASGALDTSLSSGAGANRPISGLFPLRDGGVLVTGSFTTFDGVARPNLVRLVPANATEAVAPTLAATSPEAAAVLPGAAVQLAALAAGTAPLTYRWTIQGRDGPVPLASAAAAAPTLRFLPVVPGVYTATVTVTNRAGTVTGAPIRIVVADSAPVITSLPSTVTVLSGRAVTLTVEAAGTQPLTYQWLREGTVVGTGSSLTIPRASSAQAAEYTVVLTNRLGRTTSSPVRLVVDGSARLVNLSTRTGVAPGRPLIAGFVITGPGSQRVLVRGVGPGLAAFGLTGALPNPALTVLDSAGRFVAGNDDFDRGPSSATPGGVVDGVGAFRLGSPLDSALVATLPAGAYTAQLAASPDGGEAPGGIALLEVYRADDAATRLINLSSRGFVGTGAALAIAGIAIEGEQPRRFLIRATGPALRAFGVDDALADPVLNLTSAAGQSLFLNDDWGVASNAPELAATAARLGAFALPAGSADSALLVTLAPGNYTALVNGKGESSGTALIEVYEVP